MHYDGIHNKAEAQQQNTSAFREIRKDRPKEEWII
jgi:hypothetical protein